jgi:hypothetical protein
LPRKSNLKWGLTYLLQTVKQNQIEYGLPLKILSYDELYGWTMDKIVDQIGKKNNCASIRADMERELIRIQALSVAYSGGRPWIEEPHS